MILVRPQDALHKAHLLRLLSDILDEPQLAQALYFKGGTCASLLGILDRFSVDLDFDLKQAVDERMLKRTFHQVFKGRNFIVKYENQKILEFVVKYENQQLTRSTIKVSALDMYVKANKYAQYYLPEIDRTAMCQTKETLFANKLVAVVDRYEKYHTLAGRDIYDIHHFFLQGMSYEKNVIVERMHVSVIHYLERLRDFIETKITETVINEDLNTLLPNDVFQRVRKILKTETLMFLRQELERLTKDTSV